MIPINILAGSWVFTMVIGCSQWRTSFFDDFLGDSLDADLWVVENNFTHCAPCEDANYLAKNVHVNNSLLTITTIREKTIGSKGQVNNFTSGWVRGNQSISWLVSLFLIAH